MTKAEQLDILHGQWASCTKCKLASEGRKQVVFSKGNPEARVMAIGEGPGHTEDQTGIPFTGPAGKLLDRILDVAHLNTSNVFFTNSIRCRPFNNRTPVASEIKTCSPLLLAEIDIIKPRLILLVGLTSLKACGIISSGIGKLAGSFVKVFDKYDAMILYHPAALLHVQNIDHQKYEDYRKSLYYSMIKVRDYLARPEEESLVLASQLQQEFDWKV